MFKIILFLFAMWLPVFAQEQVTLTPKQALILEGVTTQDKQELEFKRGFTELDLTAKALGLTQTASFMARFPSDTEKEFAYKIFLPVDKNIETTHPKIKMGETPSGMFYKFIHEGAYDLIDQTYEDMADTLDEKKLVAGDYLVEEYVKDLRTTNENEIIVHIYVTAKPLKQP